MSIATADGVDIRLASGVRIRTVQEQAWPGVELQFLLHGVAPAEFARTRAFGDARFVDPVTHLLRMSYHSTVVATPHGTVLVDTCIGNHKHRPLIERWHQQEFPYLERLAAAGLQPADIDFVCCTHLHADHVGWNTRLENGKWVPTFPNARYLFAEPELRYWEQVRRDDPAHIFSVSWDDSIAPVLAAGLGEAVAPDHEILPGVRLQPAFGHSPGNVVIDVRAGSGRAVMSGDVMHHPVQIERPDWNSIYDQDRTLAQAARAALLDDVADGRTWLVAAHFAGPTALTISRDGNAYRYA